jgi:replication-associated recombination protein RarA
MSNRRHLSVGRASDMVNSPATPMFTGSDQSSIYSHARTEQKLLYIIASGAIPNLLFYGKNGSGKRTVLNWFMMQLYETSTILDRMVYYVDCNLNNGIQYIRDEVHFIAKRNIDGESKTTFKTIIFLNADKLTVDSQSALRRCMEIHNNHTRFMFVTTRKFFLSKPIRSRMGHIHVMPERNGVFTDVNLNKIDRITPACDELNDFLDTLQLNLRNDNPNQLIEATKSIVNMGYSALNVIEYIRSCNRIPPDVKYRNISEANICRGIIKNEEALIFTILSNSLIRKESSVKNIYSL